MFSSLRFALSKTLLPALCVVGSAALARAEPSARFEAQPAPSDAAASASSQAPHETSQTPAGAASVPEPASCPRVDWRLWQARRLVERRSLLEALSAYAELVLLDPSCGWALVEYANLRAALGDFTEAERLYALASRVAETRGAAYRERARLWRRRGNFERALSDLATAADLAPSELGLRYELASWYIERRAWAAALAEYRRIVHALSSESAERAAAELQVLALTRLAAETDPVSSAGVRDHWVRRSLSRIAKP